MSPPPATFPVPSAGAQPLPGDGCGGLCSGDAFVARLNSTLTVLTQATYLGGVKEESATALAVNLTTGDVYVTGETGSTNFPGTLGGAQPASAGAPPVPPGVTEAFVARLNGTLTLLLQATYLGGTNNETATATAIAIAPRTGDVYVAGPTRSADSPGTTGAAQPALSSGFDAYVARFNSGLTTLLRATYLGGSGTDTAHAPAIGPGGDVIVVGRTDSANFPGTAGGAQPAKSLAEDAFVARLSADLTALIQATLSRRSVRALQSCSMRSRTLTLLLALYVMLDFGSASLPGAFAFDPDDSVDAVSRASDWAEAVVPLWMKDTAGWRGHDVLEDTPVPRPVVRPRVRPVVMQSACSSAPCRDHSSPGDDH